MTGQGGEKYTGDIPFTPSDALDWYREATELGLDIREYEIMALHLLTAVQQQRRANGSGHVFMQFDDGAIQPIPEADLELYLDHSADGPLPEQGEARVIESTQTEPSSTVVSLFPQDDA